MGGCRRDTRQRKTLTYLALEFANSIKTAQVRKIYAP